MNEDRIAKKGVVYNYLSWNTHEKIVGVLLVPNLFFRLVWVEFYSKLTFDRVGKKIPKNNDTWKTQDLR